MSPSDHVDDFVEEIEIQAIYPHCTYIKLKVMQMKESFTFPSATKFTKLVKNFICKNYGDAKGWWEEFWLYWDEIHMGGNMDVF